MTRSTPFDPAGLSLSKIDETRCTIAARIRATPVWRWSEPAIDAVAPPAASIVCKLELFQVTGSFKPRGALSVMTALAPAELARGVTAVSAGNHAIAVAYAARALGTSAKVVMMRSANPARVALCREYGADIVSADDIRTAFDVAQGIVESEGRTLVHPFEGERTALGTATLGVEFLEQVPDLDAVVVPVGGGGLCGGVAAAVKQMRPACAVYGVEPVGADAMFRSFQSGRPERIERVATIADSLGAPYAGEYTLAACRHYLDDLVLVTDDELRDGMRLLFRGLKLAVEPAGAAATVGMVGPLRERLAGKRVGVIVCGSNIDGATYARELLHTVS